MRHHHSLFAALALLGAAASCPVAATPMAYTLSFSGTGFTAYPTYEMSGSFSFVYDRDAPQANGSGVALTGVSLNVFGVDYTTANTTLTYYSSVGGRLVLSGAVNGVNIATNTNDISVDFRNFLAAPAGAYAPYMAGFSRSTLFGIQYTPLNGTSGTLGIASPGGGDPEEVPEPAMLGLFGLGAAGLALTRRRRRATA